MSCSRHFPPGAMWTSSSAAATTGCGGGVWPEPIIFKSTRPTSMAVEWRVFLAMDGQRVLARRQRGRRFGVDGLNGVTRYRTTDGRGQPAIDIHFRIIARGGGRISKAGIFSGFSRVIVRRNQMSFP